MALVDALSFSRLEKLSQKAGDSFFVFDHEVFRQNIRHFRSAVRYHYANSHLAYALKANYMPGVLRVLAEERMMAEAASRMEYDIARTQLSATNIIFNGPLKRREDLLAALQAGSRVNLDSLLEIEELEQLSPSLGRIEVGIRVTFDVVDAQNSRFGFSAETTELEEAISRLEAIKNLRITGLHAHFSTLKRSLDSYRERSERLVELARQLRERIALTELNVGGGFFGDMPKELRVRFGEPVPEFGDYAATFTAAFKREYPDEAVRLVFEPGVSVVADSMAYVTRVLDVRPGRNRDRVLSSGSITIVNPNGSSILAEPRYLRANNISRTSRKFDLVGTTCMEHDVLCADQEAIVDAGDWVVFANRGAYSNVCKGPFIVPSPPIVSIDGRLLRRREEARDVLATYVTAPAKK